jgi:hypothetical protein
MGVKVSGIGYRSYRAAKDAGNKPLNEFLSELSKEGRTNRQGPLIGAKRTSQDP